VAKENRTYNFKNYKITFTRRIVQALTFLFINYVIIEWIFQINLISFEGFVKILPILNSPRNPLSKGAGMIEFIFYFLAEGEFPFLIIGLFLLIILLTSRFFCGWICPIGTIQDVFYAIPGVKKAWNRNWKRTERKFPDHDGALLKHSSLLNLKYLIIILVVIIIIPLGITKTTDIVFYFQYKRNIGQIAQKPLGYFSLSEYIFVYFPEFIQKSIERKGLDLPDFMWPMEDMQVFLRWCLAIGYLFFYIVVIILAFFYPRVYCRYLCPFAACASVVSDYSLLKLGRSPVHCVGRAECGICEHVCPKQIKILDEPFEFFTGNGECNLCMKCKEKCPYDAIQIKFG